MKKTKLPGDMEPRRQGEEKLIKGKKKESNSSPAKVESLHIIDELKERQSQLEKQNEVLVQSRAEVQAVLGQYSDLYDFAPVGYFTLNRDGMIRQTNQVGADLLGVEYGELIKRGFGVFVSEKSMPVFNSFFERLLSGEGKEDCELEFMRNGHEIIWARMEATCFEGGDETRAMLTDVTERKQAEEALKKSEEQYRTLVELASDGIFLTGSDGLFVEANSAGCQLLGYTRVEILQLTMCEIMTPFPNRDNVLKELKGGNTLLVECDLICKDGHLVSVEISSRQLPNGRFMGIVRDISGRKHAEEILRHANKALEVAHLKLQNSLEYEHHLARTDSLTGISNRHHFFELASRAFSSAARYQRPLAIIMFDADHLKEVNDTFGHAAGDKMLVQIAKAAEAEMRNVDVLARYGGDEFIILLPETSAKQAHFIAERIRESVSPLAITLSMGIAEILHKPVDENVERIIRRADKALYAAKAKGRNCIVTYSPDF
ncbi:MAG: sensor domain-containing diguanylate cyclase [Chloroflexi bacterium]|nr:sensor domain-containing diguanylate cyclase [Chloroflexota bacterium]